MAPGPELVCAVPAVPPFPESTEEASQAYIPQNLGTKLEAKKWTVRQDWSSETLVFTDWPTQSRSMVLMRTGWPLRPVKKSVPLNLKKDVAVLPEDLGYIY